MVTMGSAIGGKSGMVCSFIMALGMHFFSNWFSDKIVLQMHRAREIAEHDHPAFYGMVRRLAIQAGLPKPEVYILPSESPNAHMFIVNPLTGGGRVALSSPHPPMGKRIARLDSPAIRTY